jgi:hypothetical protein
MLPAKEVVSVLSAAGEAVTAASTTSVDRLCDQVRHGTKGILGGMGTHKTIPL